MIKQERPHNLFSKCRNALWLHYYCKLVFIMISTRLISTNIEYTLKMREAIL